MIEQFSAYTTSLITVGICAFLCETIASGFSKSKIGEKGLRFIISLCMFTAIILPVLLLFGKDITEKNSIKYKTEIPKETVDETFFSLLESELSNEIKNAVYEKFGIQAANVSIKLNVSENSMKFEKINVTVAGDDIEAKDEISKYIKQLTEDDKAPINILAANE